jgi:hypothetical protein
MIDNLFTAALALTLLVGGTLAIGSTLQEGRPLAACNTQAASAAPRTTAAQTVQRGSWLAARAETASSQLR